MSEERYSSLKNTYGEEHFNKVWNSKILVVGAGGIGCEILKNLVLGGFKTIEVIDLDTIDVSNLNRQFLFRPEHVGKPKSLIAAEAATRFNPDVKITPHYGNVKDNKFGISYISTFNIVLNALDNVDARRHVNRLCLSANVPLIDSGTTGYLGQVMPIFKGVTSCYECMPKPTQKVYPICTIRSTPDKPVHCIVWAKECFKLLFGNTSESMLFEDSSLGEVSSYMDVLELYRNNRGDMNISSIINLSKDMLIALYHTEVEKKIDMDVYKNAKTKPVSTSINIFESAADIALSIVNKDNNQLRRPSSYRNWDQNLWSDSECAIEFMLTLNEAFNMKGDNNTSLLGKLVFDKDDDLAMRFVIAASNIRSRIFSITPLNFHDCKGIAGNIIPAIATTNAIVAGIQVLQAIKVLKCGEISKATIKSICPYTYCLRLPTRRGYYLQPSSPEEPNPLCYVCSSNQLTLQV
jgi:ubiquitin-like 1-activating enzyme E1 B